MKMVGRKTGNAGQPVQIRPLVKVLLDVPQHTVDALLVRKRFQWVLLRDDARRLSRVDRSAKKVERVFCRWPMLPPSTITYPRSSYERF